MIFRFGRTSLARAGAIWVSVSVLLVVFAIYPALLRGQTSWRYAGSEEERSDSSNSTAPNLATMRSSGRQLVLMACGEAARPAAEPFRSIVARLEEASGVNAQVYESVARTSPHARPGGCIFYNSGELNGLFHHWFVLSQPRLNEPLLYAIFAHELGHLSHNDFSEERAQVDPMIRELEADRFAGYMLSRLNISVDDLTDYYRLTGDDFTGIRHDHGNSGQRAEAFMQGWRRAELGLLEQSTIGVGSTDHP
jgi:hypothetical protein